jgi:tRNA-specific 2-thiouridylase
VKFDRLFERADILGFDAVATGHHARVVTRADGSRCVARGTDRAKDQSYVIHMLGQETLARVLLPVGSLTKTEVRARATTLGLRTADKPDSQDVCFITAARGRRSFLDGRIDLTPGRVVDRDGREVGRVDAVELITIGQRRGLGLPGGGSPRFVVGADPAAGTVTVGGADELLVDAQRVGPVTWAAGAVIGAVDVQVSAHGTPKRAVVEPERPGDGRGRDGRGRVAVRWVEPQRRIGPGQSVVFYDHDEVLGGGPAL